MVVPPYALVDAPVADLRATPDKGAELVDQVHYHELLRVLGSRDGWHYVQAPDHYFGWIPGGAVQVMPGSREGRLVGRTLAPIYREADTASQIVGYLPAGTTLATRQQPAEAGPWVRLPSAVLERESGATGAFVSLADAVVLADLPHRPPTAADLVATAEAFLGVPYLWGGTAATGLDCSGLMLQVYRLNGVGLDRDADQQALEGRPADAPRAGDLVFYGSESVTHVGLVTAPGEMLHAPMSGAFVERRGLADRYASPRAIRRFLMDPE